MTLSNWKIRNLTEQTLEVFKLFNLSWASYIQNIYINMKYPCMKKVCINKIRQKMKYWFDIRYAMINTYWQFKWNIRVARFYGFVVTKIFLQSLKNLLFGNTYFWLYYYDCVQIQIAFKLMEYDILNIPYYWKFYKVFCFLRKWVHSHVFFAMFTKGDNFYGCLFAFLMTKYLSEIGSTLTGKKFASTVAKSFI